MRPLRAEEGSRVIIPRTALRIWKKTPRCSFKGHFVLLGRALTFLPYITICLGLDLAPFCSGLCHGSPWNRRLVDPWGPAAAALCLLLSEITASSIFHAPSLLKSPASSLSFPLPAILLFLFPFRTRYPIETYWFTYLPVCLPVSQAVCLFSSLPTYLMCHP